MDEKQPKSSLNLLAASIFISSLVVGGSLIYSAGSKATRTNGLAEVKEFAPGTTTKEPENNLPLLGKHVLLGDARAPVTINEWGDYQCPFCGKFFSDTEPQIREQYIKTGKVQMVYRDFAFLGPESVAASNAAWCAGEQGKFWAYHDRLFDAEIADGRENNGNLKEELFTSLAGELKLDQTAFGACIKEERYKAQVEQDYADGVAAGVRGTPATFVNKTLLSGAVPFSSFRETIERELSKAARP